MILKRFIYSPNEYLDRKNYFLGVSNYESLSKRIYSKEPHTVNNIKIFIDFFGKSNIGKKAVSVGCDTFKEWSLLNSGMFDEIIVYDTEEDVLDILGSIEWDIRILGEEYRDKPFTGRSETLDKCYFNSRPHDFSMGMLCEISIWIQWEYSCIQNIYTHKKTKKHITSPLHHSAGLRYSPACI